MIVVKYLISLILAYLIGSFSFAVFISTHFLGGDVRTKGSGNPGATNMARVYGIGAGIGTGLLDAGKMFLAALVGKWLGGEWGMALSCAGCVLGHCYPVFYGFKGGKAVATGASVAVLLGPVPLITCLVTFFGGALVSKKVSVGSMLAAVAMAVSAVLMHVGTPKLLLALFTAAVVIFRHRANIRRLIQGTEPNFQPHHRTEDKNR